MFDENYIDPFDELVILHERCNTLELHYNDLARAHNLLMQTVENSQNTIKVLIDTIKVLQQSQIYLLEEDTDITN